MKRFLIVPLLVVLIGCASFSTTVFRSEKLAADTGVAVVSAFNAYARTQTNNPDIRGQQNMVWDASRKLSASLAVLESMRSAYDTNGVTQGQVTAALMAVNGQSSNLLWLVVYLKGK